MSYLLHLIHHQEEERIEFARGQLTAPQVTELVDHYSVLPNWPSKVSLVLLVQDYRVPELRPVMLDILHAPFDPRSESVEWAKAAALCYLDGDYDQFSRLFTDREYLLQRVRGMIGDSERDTPSG